MLSRTILKIIAANDNDLNAVVKITSIDEKKHF